MTQISKITQIVSRSSRNEDGTRGPLVVFFTTEDHIAGYEVTSGQINSSYSEGESDARSVVLLAELIFRFGAGELVFVQDDNRIRSVDQSVWVGFSTVQKLRKGEALASSVFGF
jgi:hypothetical protein